MKTTNLVNKYMNRLGDPHDITHEGPSLNKIDFQLRSFMGKTNDVQSPEGYASHFKILKRQKRIENDDLVCRRCLKDLSEVGVGRYNDFLVIRAKDCTQPICSSCAKHNPDNYHRKFKEAISMRKTITKNKR